MGDDQNTRETTLCFKDISILMDCLEILINTMFLKKTAYFHQYIYPFLTGINFFGDDQIRDNKAVFSDNESKL